MGVFATMRGKLQAETVPAQPLMHYLKLDEESFRCLVRGGILYVDNSLSIILEDIGFTHMDKALEDAKNGIDIHKDHILGIKYK